MLPTEWLLTLTGLADQGCDRCTEYDGLFTLTEVSECSWRYDFWHDKCGCLGGVLNWIGLDISDVAGGFKITVVLHTMCCELSVEYVETITWERTFTGHDCLLGGGGEILPFTNQTTGCVTPSCDVSGSTAIVQAVP